MASITRTAKENGYDWITTNRSTWTFVITGSDYNVTSTGQTVSISAPTATAKYVKPSGIPKAKGEVDLSLAFPVVNTWIGSTKRRNAGAMTSGTAYTLSETSTFPQRVSADTIFTSSNPTTKSIALTTSGGIYAYARSWGSTNYDYEDYYSGDLANGTIGYIYYKCPPALTSSPSITKDTADYYAGLTKATISVPFTYSSSGTTGTAKYGGYIKSVTVSIGGQSTTETFTSSTKPTETKTYQLDVEDAGTITPTVTFVDSRDQSATVQLSAITVTQYNIPAVTFDVYRTNSSGTKDDEGHYGLVEATINYTSGATHLVEPTVEINGTDVTDISGASTTWYSATPFSSSTEISDWSTVQSGATVYGLIDANYASSHIFAEDTSYEITLTAEDTYNPSQPITQTLSTAFYTIDFQAGGKEIAFGAPANDNLTSYQNGLFKCGMDTVFNGDVAVNGDLTAVGDTTLTTGNTEIENPYFSIDTTAASGTTDGDLYAAITALGWQSDVIE